MGKKTIKVTRSLGRNTLTNTEWEKKYGKTVLQLWNEEFYTVIDIAIKLDIKRETDIGNFLRKMRHKGVFVAHHSCGNKSKLLPKRPKKNKKPIFVDCMQRCGNKIPKDPYRRLCRICSEKASSLSQFMA